MNGASRARSTAPRRTRVLRTVAVVMIAGGLSLGPGRALAQLTDLPETGHPGYLQVAAAPYPATTTELSPGQRVPWIIEARLADAESGTLNLQLRGSGELAEHLHGLQIAVETCPTAFTGASPTCPDGGATVVHPAPLRSVATRTAGTTWALPDLVRGHPRQLLVELSLPATGAEDPSLQSLTGDVEIGLYAAGTDTEAPAPAPPGEPRTDAGTPGPQVLPRTGADVVSLALIALGALLLGLTLRRTTATPADG